MFAVAIVDQVLDAADVEAGATRDRFDLFDDLERRLVALDAQPCLRGIDGAGAAHELDSVRRLARVGGTEIE